MRILHIVEATIAGVRTHVQTLVGGLAPHGVQSVVVCPLRRQNSHGDEQFVNYLTSVGIPIWPVAMQRSISPRADAAALQRLITILRHESFDLVHLHSSKAGFLGRLAVRASGNPAAVVYSPHGLAFLGTTQHAHKQFYLRLEQLAGPLCERIIAVSPGERDVIIAAGIARPERVVCVPNGIVAPPRLTDAERAATRAMLGIPANAPLIGTAARLAPQKNPGRFLAAAAQVLRVLPEAHFVWCGGGDLAEVARTEAARQGIAHACHFIGHREDARRIMAAYDIFWLTSDYEGLPIAPLEAMALGVPIIATDVLGTRDLLCTGAGLLVPAEDTAALAQATVRLMQYPERRVQLARAGFRYFLAQGSAEQMLEAMLHVYESLVLERGKGIAMPYHRALFSASTLLPAAQGLPASGIRGENP